MAMQKKITVFTPTYNRAYILPKCYKSLSRQTCKDFEWLIIDDGSTDHTKELVADWQKQENGFPIRYICKENGGLHTGYNTAIANMETELSVCIDSDDSMPEKGIEEILNEWQKVKDSGAAGMIGLDVDQNGNLIGKRLPEGELINAASLLCVPGMGDKKYVVRNDLLRTVAPMPVFAGEKNFNPHYLIIKLSKQYCFHPVNQCFCLVEYQPDGMTANIWKQYVNSPRSFAELRRAIMEVPELTWQYRLKNMVHYCSSSQLAGNRNYIKESPRKLLTVLCTPAGWALTWYIRRKAGE